MGWEDVINGCVAQAKVNNTLDFCQYGIFSKEGAFCGSVGKTKQEGQIDAESVAKIHKAFSGKTDAAKDPVRSSGIRVGGTKYNLIRDQDNYIALKSGELGVVFVDCKKDFVVYGIADDFRTNQGNLIKGVEKCAEYLEKQP